MNQTSLPEEDRRVGAREYALHLISFVLLIEGRQDSPVGMGRTLDVGNKGIKVELYQAVNVGQRCRVVIGVREDEFTIEGEVAHVTASGKELHIVGMEFDNPHPELVGSVAADA